MMDKLHILTFGIFTKLLVHITLVKSVFVRRSKYSPVGLIVGVIYFRIYFVHISHNDLLLSDPKEI